MSIVNYILSVFTPFGKITYHVCSGKLTLLEDSTEIKEEDGLDEVCTNKEV